MLDIFIIIINHKSLQKMTQERMTLPITSIPTQHLTHYALGLIAFICVIVGVIWVAKTRNPRKHLRCKLIDKKNITHDTVVFKFHLPKNRKTLGLKIGQHIEISALTNGKNISRKYTPISRADQKDTFDLLIKIYNKCQQFPEGGAMSLYLDSLKINDQIDITLPYGRFNYVKEGHVSITTIDKKVLKRKYKNFFMVAGGTGITPIYQIIQYISQCQKQNTPNLTLLFANRSEADILLQEQLKQYQKLNPKFKCFFSVDKSTNEEWKGLVGFVDEAKIQKCLGDFKKDIKETLFISCGPPILQNILQNIWTKKLQVSYQDIHRF